MDHPNIALDTVLLRFLPSVLLGIAVGSAGPGAGALFLGPALGLAAGLLANALLASLAADRLPLGPFALAPLTFSEPEEALLLVDPLLPCGSNANVIPLFAGSQPPLQDCPPGDASEALRDAFARIRSTPRPAAR